MTALFSHAPRAKSPAFGTAWLRLSLRRMADAWMQRRRRAAHRRELRSLDEHALRDIGLSHRAAAEWPQEPRGGPS